MDSIGVEGTRLINKKLTNLSKYMNFKRIFDSLFQECDFNMESTKDRPIYYIIMYQTFNAQNFILFE